MRAAKKFRRWVSDLGVGTAGVARLLECNPSYVSLLQNGTRTPSLALAARIERMTQRAKDGPIMAAEWVPVRGPARTRPRTTEEADAA